jgi:ribosomal protein S18 acetylase RimI-like enzyme
MDILLRKAMPEDSAQAVPLIAATIAGYGVMTLGLGDEALERTALATWFVLPGNRFSYEYCWLAIVDGEIAGLLSIFRGDEIPKLEGGLVRGIFGIYRSIQIFGMVWRLLILSHTDEANRNEFLIAHLAVTPKFQRKGVAHCLLEKAELEARQNRLSRLVLEVEIDNHPAESLYRKCGFTREHTTRFNRRARILKCPGFHKLVKIV